MERNRTILVLGATGQQGGAVARHLLRAGWSVRGLTRTPGSMAAETFAAAGGEVVAGDMGDADSLDRAMQGAYGVFSVQPPAWLPSHEIDREEAQLGCRVVDAAVRAGVQHFIYCSVLAADGQASFRPSGKWAVEQYLRAAQVPWTIVRPAGFMDNYVAQAAALKSGVLADPTDPDLPVSLVATDDIGGIVAALFDEGETHFGATIDIAGDRLTVPQIARQLGASLGWQVAHQLVPVAALREASMLLAELVDWLNTHGYPTADREALRRLYPALQNFPTWLVNSGAARIRAASA